MKLFNCLHRTRNIRNQTMLTTQTVKFTRCLAVAASRRPFSTTLPLRHKESSGENENVEQHKHDLLQKHGQGRGEWKPELASDSEEAVRADKGKQSIKEMQEQYTGKK
ncbi:hypothetical protein VHEMI08085 [[Torrubiella] hemipterigena]|uniref:Mitochondrial carrier protein pet8 n=1 Tax=[Torrubiella] hemipterigena TaxID=1531966 RepID=A0A0A1T5I5_9HYPO|nr:hypothetical protein VHEMI08085 [[Torrubiella] hemipterigena]